MSEVARHETELERYDRNWTDMQQQLRIIQTGTQLLAGFLLTLPFQPRFAELSAAQVGIYLALVVLAASISILALASVATHRLLFQRQLKRLLVRSANRILIVCLVASALLFAGTVLLIFNIVLSEAAGFVTGGLLFVATAVLWVAVPLRIRRHSPVPDQPPSPRPGQEPGAGS